MWMVCHTQKDMSRMWQQKRRKHVERQKKRSGECLSSVAFVLGHSGPVQEAHRRQEAHDAQTVVAGTRNRVACEPQMLQTRESSQMSDLSKVCNLWVHASIKV